MDELLTIGAFARRTGLTVKALRHYDELGLLTPTAVQNGYRLYAPAQARRAEAIRRLRELELSLPEIAAVLTERDPAELRRRLLLHHRQLAMRIARLQSLQQRLQPLIEGDEAVMTTKAEALDAETHRRLGVDLFNYTWTFLDKAERTPEEDDAMIHAAYASRYHWSRASDEPKHHGRGEWQLARVFAVLGRSEPALYHARRCLHWCEVGPVEEWETPFAHEALARAHAVAGEWDEAERHERLARELGAAIVEAEERTLLENDLATLPRR